MKKIIKALIKKIKDYGTLVMFSHTIFSFSFAAIAFLIASEGKINYRILLWALIALLSARTGANAINRAIDAKIDAKNPRTATRQIPKGEISIKETLMFTAICFALLIFSAYQLNLLCFILSPAALFMMIIYSYTKRFTWTCHLILGLTCSIAPVGAWLAVTGKFSFTPILLAAINCLWVAGFDIIYGTQDYDFDRKNNIHSIPSRFGIKGALIISSGLHLCTMALIFLFLWLHTPPMGMIFTIGCIIVAVLMFIQHKIVTPDNLANVTIASYSISQITSIVLLLAGVADIFL